MNKQAIHFCYQKQHLFGDVINGVMVRNEIGVFAEQYTRTGE